MSRLRHILDIVVVPLLYLLFLAGATMHTIEKKLLPVDIAQGETVRIGTTSITSPDQLEFYASWDSTAGEQSALRQTADGVVSTLIVRPVPYYSAYQIVAGTIVSVIIFCLGYFVFLFRTDHDLTKIFYACTTATAVAVSGVQTVYSFLPRPLGHILYVVFSMSYGLIPIIFFHFTRKFIRAGPKAVDDAIRWGYIASILLVLLQMIFYLNAAGHRSLREFEISRTIGMIENAFMFLLILTGVVTIIRSYLTTRATEARKKIRLIMFGLSLGTMPFAFFWVLPIAIGGQPLIPELAFKIALLIIPVTFVVAIFRHHAMDIDILIHRSVIYSVIIAVILLIYSALVSVIVSLVGSSTHLLTGVPSAVAAVAVALVVQPLIRRVRTVVDKTFFRIEYDYRQTLLRLHDEIERSLSLPELSDRLVNQISKILPTERIAVVLLESGAEYLKVYAHRGFDLFDRHPLRFPRNRLTASVRLPISRPEFVEPSVHFEPLDQDFQQRWGIALIVPIVEYSHDPKGFVVLGSKKSGVRFTAEDIDLLVSISRQAGAVAERLFLQERLLLEHAETERLAELNRMKSYFVSSVSHDMKTPLTSIKMFAEIIRTKPRAAEEVCQYLQIIEGESDRLTRLINNVLDFSKIERGVKEYRPEIIELNAHLRQLLEILKYQLASEQVIVDAGFTEAEVMISADPDAVTEAVINLITNAVKYSTENKNIGVKIGQENGEAIIAVSDTGIGIPADELPDIFQPFFRSAGGRARSGGGLGLGLAIVKHIVDAHRGRITVVSAPGNGSTFTLRFPLFGTND
jgi:signal transduction histidine kinase